MVREQQLSDVLNEFARTMLTDFPIQAILDRLVVRIVDVLPVTSAGVTLISAPAEPRYVAASDEAALRFERLQTELGEGPCVAAAASGEAVAVPDVGADERFPAFGPRAVEAGLGAVFTFPLRRHGGQLGALDLYRATPGPLDADSLAAAQTLADVASAYVQNAQARVDLAAAYDQARERALHDPLTGLANRALLALRLEHAGARAMRSGSATGVLFVDLDRFKSVNDTHGHRAGDRLLVAVAERLGALVRPSDTLARLAGDEFVILCEDLDHPSRVEALAARVHTALSAPFSLGDTAVAITASVGVAFAGRADDIPERLVQDADAAMYQAKRQGGGGHEVIDLRERRVAERRASLGSDLHLALARGELRLDYQPIVDTAGGRVCGVEALLRWDHPRFGPVPPAVAVPLAEEEDLIGGIGDWALRQACEDRHRWGRDDLGVAVNVSARQLLSQDYAASVEAALCATSTAARLLTIEVTDDAFTHDGDRALVVIEDLRDLGVAVTLEHFGTRSASLDHLRRFTVDAVKLDPAFVAGLPHDRAGSAVVSAVVHLAHRLGIDAVAPGVERADQRRAVVALECDRAQGFLVARPATIDGIAALLAAEWGEGAAQPVATSTSAGDWGPSPW
ncbi:MAG: putative bifunctional diguanylate cyclase/phosphodiesterase [Acidimicrobiales bacterium]